MTSFTRTSKALLILALLLLPTGAHAQIGGFDETPNSGVIQIPPAVEMPSLPEADDTLLIVPSRTLERLENRVKALETAVGKLKREVSKLRAQKKQVAKPKKKVKKPVKHKRSKKQRKWNSRATSSY